MNLTSHTTGDISILELSGRFDAANVTVVARWFEEHPEVRRIVVNLRGVGFVDSSGLATLVKGLKRCRQNGGDLYLCELQPPVVIIIELTRLDKAFKSFADEQAAVNAFLS
ncbi:MAG: STAS domain-containing protein [Anaerolineae bacterium]|nr:STAS domain-containing protein [Anaerolineae bacterium]